MRQKILWTLTVLVLLATIPAAAQSGGLRYTVSVVEFENQAGWRGQWDIGNAWGTVFTDLLNGSGRFIVLGESDMRGAALDEQDFAASGRTAQGAKTPVTGQMTPAQLLVKGAITHVQHDTKSGGGRVRIKGFSIGGKGGKSEVSLTIYMVDSTTGQVMASQSVTGEAGRKGASIGYSNYDWGAAFGGQKEDNLGKAITDAADQALQWMIGQLPGIRWRGSVALVKDGQIYINRGTREGVSQGQEFVVGSTDEIRDPDTGELLDESLNQVARIRADQVREKLAICSVVGGSASGVKRGMAVFQP